MKTFLLFFLSGFTCLSLVGQSFLVSDPVNIRHDYGYEIVGRLRDKILLFRDKYDEFEVQAFDGNLRASWKKELELDKRGIQILTVVGAKNDFSVVFKVKRRNQAFLRIHKYDPEANLIDSLTIKHYPDHFFTSPSLELIQSEDNNCFVVYNSNSRGEVDATSFRIDKMQLLWDRKFVLEESPENVYFEKSVVANNGDFFIVSEENNKHSRLDAHEYHIYMLNKEAERHIRVPLEEFLTHDAVFSYDNTNRMLVGAGLYGNKNRNRANGAFYLKLNPIDTSSTLLEFQPFDSRFISIMKGKDVSEDSKGLEDLKARYQVLRRDGGTVLIGEAYYEVERGSGGNRGFVRDIARSVVDYHCNDIFIIAFDADGKIHWRTILHKKQYSQDDDATFSSFFTFQMPQNLRFLFNDDIKYENTCSEYTVNNAGDFDRNSLFSTVDQSLRIRFRDGKQISANEVLLPSEFRNKLKLVLMRY